MRNVFQRNVLMLVTILATLSLGCTERADLAPVRNGYQIITDVFPDVPYPPPVTNGRERPPMQDRQKIPPAPLIPYSKPSETQAYPAKREAPVPARSPYTAMRGKKGETQPKTTVSTLTIEKRKMAEPGQDKPARKVPATEKKRLDSKTKKNNAVLSFDWPLSGNILKNYTQTGKKGIKIAGKKGQKVRAAEDGKIVYSGQGLIGYGNLLIIKHNDQYLTAYANNSALLAKEGDVVKKGQEISTVGGSSSRAMLHFEIRKQGKSVNPLTLLPKL
jgi:lipoprotein NlpD